MRYPKVGEVWKVKDSVDLPHDIPRLLFIENIRDNDMRGIIVVATRLGYKEEEQFFIDRIAKDCEWVSG